MRDRLTKLIINAPKLEIKFGSRAQGRTLQTAQNIADYLLADGWIRPPCRVGDTVFCIIPTSYGSKVLRKMTVKDICIELDGDGIDNDLSCCGVSSGTGLSKQFYFYEIGKTVFLTREEAEAKLKGEQ